MIKIITDIYHKRYLNPEKSCHKKDHKKGYLLLLKQDKEEWMGDTVNIDIGLDTSQALSHLKVLNLKVHSQTISCLKVQNFKVHSQALSNLNVQNLKVKKRCKTLLSKRIISRIRGY